MGRQRGLSLGKRLKHYPKGSSTPMASSMQDMRPCSIHVASQDENSQVFPFSRSPVSPFHRFPVFPFPRVPVFPFSRFPVSPLSRFPVFPSFCFPSFSLGKRLKYYPRELLLQWLPPCKTCAHAVCMWLHRGRTCLLYTSPSPRDKRQSRMPSSA